MDTKALIDALNRDLANEYAAVIQYTQYSAKVKGPWRAELRAFFQGEIPDEQLHAQYLSDKISALGGNPTTQPSEVPNANTAEDMLRAILVAEQKAVDNYSERAQQADELGDVALKVHLENMVADEAKHKEEVEQMLAGWPLGKTDGA